MVGRRGLDGDDDYGDGVDDLDVTRTQRLGPREGAWSKVLGGHGPTWHCAEDSLRVAR